jgi:oxygen-independent coproporphyrinogen-3 oxidase
MRIDADRFEELISTPLNRMFGLELFLATKLGYLRKNGRVYELTDKAAYLYHDVEQAYTTAYIDKMWHISRLQPFPEKIILK